MINNMRIRKTILIVILIGLAVGDISSQDKKFTFFGSYSYGIGNIPGQVSKELVYPEKDEVNKLRSGSTNQLEAGVFYHSVGVGIIHNTYATNATTSYVNADVNGDAYFEDGVLSDKLNLSFTGIEVLYKIPVLSSKFDVTWKIGLGIQSYSINKDFNLMGTYPSHDNYTLKGSIATTLIGVEINYQLLKNVSIGLETSILPGNYKKLTNADSPSYIYTDNVTRISSGLKIKITI